MCAHESREVIPAKIGIGGLVRTIIYMEDFLFPLGSKNHPEFCSAPSFRAVYQSLLSGVSMSSLMSTESVNSEVTRATRVRFRVRRVCLTLNNPTTRETVEWNRIVLLGNQSGDSSKDITFFVVQSEESESGTFHFQAYCEFRKAVGLRVIKAIFGDRVHVEAARGSFAQNIIYCTKVSTRSSDDVRSIAGSWGLAKQSGNTVMAVAAVMRGEDMATVLEMYPVEVMRYGFKFEELICRRAGRRDSVPIVTILTGVTGSGKSVYAQTVWPKAYWVAPPASGGRVWWGGYCCEEVCVFDDFTSGWFKLTNLLRFIDSHPLKVAPKGSQVEFNSGHLIFTCNIDPRDWYSGYEGKSEHKDALERRIQEFATIVDCSKRDDGTFVRVLRTEEFKFRGSFDVPDLVPAGLGDQSQGNGYNLYGIM